MIVAIVLRCKQHYIVGNQQYYIGTNSHICCKHILFSLDMKPPSCNTSIVVLNFLATKLKFSSNSQQDKDEHTVCVVQGYKLSWYPRPCGYQEHGPFSAEVDLGCGLCLTAEDLSCGFLSECYPWVAMAYSRLQKFCNKQAEQWKTTIDLLCLNREEGHAEAER